MHPFFDEVRAIQDHSKFDYAVIPKKINYSGNIPVEHFDHYASLMHKNEI